MMLLLLVMNDKCCEGDNDADSDRKNNRLKWGQLNKRKMS